MAMACIGTEDVFGMRMLREGALYKVLSPKKTVETIADLNQSSDKALNMRQRLLCFAVGVMASPSDSLICWFSQECYHRATKSRAGDDRYANYFLHPALAPDATAGTFGSDMGEIDGIKPGRLLWQDAWNSRLYGPLDRLYTEGAKLGTDLWFHKNRQSGLWGAQTPLGLWLQENQSTTLFLGGVNIDQCVWGTLLDGFYKGFDVILVPDLSDE
ncbi:Isochorismatase hydrolase [Aspergillus affinis]|uniref:Isochorismatase hydrolase n=1 Tax=Aspergillus affinis TaxID=1070780 RepID=UPI0022FED3F1|nr:Isochorismatase hydrolase [Aspergillus affinis]KAI9040692.1 Isochorismatase hydrolase [Aspergillus affinis]